MTSTPFNVGLGDGQRSSSRVLRPPGGGHTDIFGGEPAQARRRHLSPSLTGIIFSQDEEASKPENGTEVPQNGQSCPDPSPQTPEAPEPVKPDECPTVVPKPTEEPVKRVRVPPGGFSSGFW